MEFVEYEKTLTISTTTRERSRPFTAALQSKRDYLRRSATPVRRPVRSNTDVEEIKRTRRRNVADPNLQENNNFLTPYHEGEVSGLVKRKSRRKYIFSRQGNRRKNNGSRPVSRSSVNQNMDKGNDLSKEGNHCGVNRITCNNNEEGSELSHILREIRSEKTAPDKGPYRDNGRRQNNATKYNCKTILPQQESKVDDTDTNEFKQYNPTQTTRNSNDVSQTSGYCSVQNVLISEISGNDCRKESKCICREPGLKQISYDSINVEHRESLTKECVALDRNIKTIPNLQTKTANEWRCLDTRELQRCSNNSPNFNPIVAKNIKLERFQTNGFDNRSEVYLARQFNSFSQNSPRNRPVTSERPLSRKDIFDFGEEKHFEKLIKHIGSLDCKSDIESDTSQERNESDTLPTSPEVFDHAEDMSLAASFSGNSPRMTSSILNPVDDCNLSDSDTLDDMSSVKFGGRTNSDSPPHSAMKKRGNLGSAGKKQRVKFDLDLEIHVVPRDSVHSTPIDFIPAEEDMCVNEDSDNEVSMLKMNSVSDAFYENNDLNYDLNNAFGKVSIRGTLTPFRVISRDSVSASGRSSSSFTNSNFPTRRDSIDIIEMQKFLKQQARERALNSSALRNRGNLHDKNTQNEVLSKSSYMELPKTSLVASKFAQNIVPKHGPHQKFVPRYDHIQMQRKYDDWEDRRRRKQRLYEHKANTKNSREPKHVDSAYLPNKNSRNVELPMIPTSHFEPSEKRETNNSPYDSCVVSNLGIRRIMSADPSVLNSPQNHINSHSSQNDFVSYHPMTKPFKSASSSLPSPKINSRTFKQSHYDSNRRFDNSGRMNDVCRKIQSFNRTNQKTLATKQNQNKMDVNEKTLPTGNGSSFNQFNFAKLSDGARSALKDAHRSYVRNFNDSKEENSVTKVASSRSLSTANSSSNSQLDGLSLNGLSRDKNSTDERSRTSSSGTAITVHSLGVTAFTPNSHTHPRKQDALDNNVLTFRNTGRVIKPVSQEKIIHKIKSRQKPLRRENRTEDAKLLLSFSKISPKMGRTYAENSMPEGQGAIFSPKIIA